MYTYAPFYSVIHEDSKVIPKERASNTQGPRRRDHKNLSNDEQKRRDNRVEWFRKNRLSGLVFQSPVIPTATGHVNDQRPNLLAETYKESRRIPKEKIITARK